MKLLYLNAADNEGGAAKAAIRLLHGVRRQGADARLYVQRKFGDDPAVQGPPSRAARVMGFARPSLEELLLGISPSRMKGPFSAAFLPDGLLPQINGFAPDLVHLHWVARMMRLETLARLRVPIVWTMHDSWAFTGGCYLPLGCTRYHQSCGRCPVLGSDREDDLSRRIWRRKEQAWRGLDLTLVAPSRWMADQARASSLFADARVEVIPNGIDAEQFRPLDKRSAREILALPQGKKLVLFGAKGVTSDPNKGFHLLLEALGEITRDGNSNGIELVVFGCAASAQAPQFGMKAHYLGWQQDEVTLALLYSAADVFVLPSISENLPYTVMEAMSCGTPCVAFKQGGVPDLIDHGISGYLARAFDPSDLAQGILWVLDDEDRQRDRSALAREKVLREFNIETAVQKHVSLYQQITGRS